MWARIVTLVSGLWMMVAPDLLGFGQRASDNGHIIGPLIISFTVISLSESTRNVKWLNLLLGAWLIFAPWILGYDEMAPFVSDYAVGLMNLILVLVKSSRKHSFAGGWPVIWKGRNIQTR